MKKLYSTLFLLGILATASAQTANETQNSTSGPKKITVAPAPKFKQKLMLNPDLQQKKVAKQQATSPEKATPKKED
jgi:hypothetical protein